MKAPLNIGIVGGGIVGLSIALRLTIYGHRVTLFDPDLDGHPASDGNAGHIGTASLVPWANPGNRKTALRYLADRHHPLRFRPSDMLRHMRWVARFMTASTATRSHLGADALRSLLDLSFPTLDPLLAAAKVAHLLRRDGLLHVFETAASFEAATAGYTLRQKHGIAVDYLTTNEIGDLEPALNPGTGRPLVRGVLLPDVGQITSPRTLRVAYRKSFTAAGGRCEPVGVQRTEGTTLHLEDGQSQTFHRIVIAAGVASGRLVGGLGVRVPVIAERGYHLQYADQGTLLRRSVLNVDRRVVYSPHDDGLRLTTGAEFTHVSRPADPDWMRPIFEGARELCPGIPPISEAVSWSGDRPSTPDSLPIIGPAPRNRHVLLAYGHGHIGLTLAAPTAALIADLIAGRTPPVDLTPYAPDRAV